MKDLLLKVYIVLFSLVSQAQEPSNPVRLKQINIVKTNFRNLKSGETVNKTMLFQDGKLSSIKTSDVIQDFFYNQRGLLDRSVKERVGSNWKEVNVYTYDADNRLTKFYQKYQEDGESVSKTVTVSYDGARVKVITKKSITKDAIVENLEYVVENGLVVRRVSRDRNEQFINKTEFFYSKGNLVRHKGVFGDTSSKFYTFDDKYAPELLIVKNIFGANFNSIVPIISMHEKEFDFQMISQSNELSYRSTTANDIIKSGKYKYNAMNYPDSYSLTEDSGMIKTLKTYIYE